MTEDGRPALTTRTLPRASTADPAVEDALFLGSEALFWSPRDVAPSTWLAHAPLVFWLVEAARPQSVVSLRAEDPTPQLALRQAVERFAPGAEIQASVDGARVDFLHVDLDMTPDVVAGLARDWAAPLAPRAILLLHGLNTRFACDEAVGFLADLRRSHPARIFEQGDGLALILTGTGHPAAIERLVARGTDDPARLAEDRLFERLGAGLRAERLAQQQGQAIRVQATRIETLSREAAEMRSAAEARERLHARQMRTRFEEIAKLTLMLEARSSAPVAPSAPSKPVVTASTRISADGDWLLAYARDLERRHALMLASTSWRALGPVRSISRRLRKRNPPPEFAPRLQDKHAAASWAAQDAELLYAYVRDLERRHAAMLESNSWRAMAPFRKLTRSLRRRQPPPPFEPRLPGSTLAGRSIPRD